MFLNEDAIAETRCTSRDFEDALALGGRLSSGLVSEKVHISFGIKRQKEGYD